MPQTRGMETFTGQPGLSDQPPGQESVLPLNSLDIWSARVSPGAAGWGCGTRWPRSWGPSVLLSAAAPRLEHTLLLCAHKAKSQRGALAQSVEDSKSPLSRELLSLLPLIILTRLIITNTFHV